MMIFLTLECWNNTENYSSLFTYTYHNNQFYFYFTARELYLCQYKQRFTTGSFDYF